MIFSVREKLIRNGINIEELDKYDVLFLPENYEDKDEDVNYYDSEDSINLYKYFKKNNVQCANSIDLGIESDVLERRGSDIWLGYIQLLVSNTLLQSFIIGLTANYIYDLLKKHSLLESPYIQERAHLDLNLPNGDHIKYDGEVERLYVILNALSSEKLEVKEDDK